MMLAEPIISVLYQHGRFDAFEAAQAGGALRFYAIGLAGYAALKVLVNAFYALDRRKTPMVVSFLAVALNLPVSYTHLVDRAPTAASDTNTPCQPNATETRATLSPASTAPR